MSNPNDPRTPRLTSLDDIRRSEIRPSRQPTGETVDPGITSLTVAKIETLNNLRLEERLSSPAEDAMRSIAPVAASWAAKGAQSLDSRDVVELYAGGLLMAADMAGNKKLERKLAKATNSSFDLSDSFDALMAEMDPVSVKTLAAEADVPITDPVHLTAKVDYSAAAFIAAEANMTPLALVAAEADLPTVDILAYEMMSMPGKMEMFQAEMQDYDLVLQKADMTPQGAAAIASALVALLQD